MPIETKELLEDLQRLENELNHVPKANDVIRDGKYAVTTYYDRFNSNWRTVENAYTEWQDTGKISTEFEPRDWQAFHKQLENDSQRPSP